VVLACHRIAPLGTKRKRQENIPTSCVKKKAPPMTAGARKVALLFSLAIIKITNTSSAVRNTSIHNPCTVLVP
jgi:hypothetical protein